MTSVMALTPTALSNRDLAILKRLSKKDLLANAGTSEILVVGGCGRQSGISKAP